MTSLKVVLEEEGDFLWSVPEQQSSNEVDWEACLESLRAAIKRQFLSLRDVDNDDIVLQDKYLCPINDGDELQALLAHTPFHQSKSDVIVVMVTKSESVSEITDIPQRLFQNVQREQVAIADNSDIQKPNDSDQKDESPMFDTADLISLGHGMGSLRYEERKYCCDLLRSLMDCDDLADLKGCLRSINDYNKFNKAFMDHVYAFIELMGYSISQDDEEILITGNRDIVTLRTMKSNFHHLSNAIQTAGEDIYQQLGINIPERVVADAKQHQSGIYDDRFITFQLIQIVMENQQRALVNKTVMNPSHLDRFLNFLAPGTSKDLCNETYFEKLKDLKIKSIGVLGTREEVVDTLHGFAAISKSIFNALKSDDSNSGPLSPGIHAILPSKLQQPGFDWDGVIFVFYWPMTTSFDTKRTMKATRYMKKDPSSLLSRVLYEISSSVCIQVNNKELDDFGVIYDASECTERKEEDEKSPERSRRSKGRKRGRGMRRTILMQFGVVNTMENQVICNKGATTKVNLKNASVRSSGGDYYLLRGNRMSTYCHRTYQQEKRRTKEADWKGTKKEMQKWVKEQSKQYYFKWDSSRINVYSHGFRILAESLAPKQWMEYKEKKSAMDEEEKMELRKTKNVDVAKQQRKWSVAVIFKHRFLLNYGPGGKSHLRQIKNQLDKMSSRQHANMSNESWDKLHEFFNLPQLSDCQKTMTIEPKTAHYGDHKIFMKMKGDSMRMLKNFYDDKKKGAQSDQSRSRGKPSEDALRAKFLDKWISKCSQYLREFRQTFYFKELEPENIRKVLRREITELYQQRGRVLVEELNIAVQGTQQDNAALDPMTIMTIKKEHSVMGLFTDPVFYLWYTLPIMVPPSYLMEFVSIDLPSSSEEIQINPLRNMQFEMMQSDTLLFHAMMGNEETIMFIRHDELDSHGNVHCSYTNVYAFNSGGRRVEQMPLKVIQRLVHLVAYCEAQKLFAVLTECELVFCIYQEDGRLRTSNKRCDLRHLLWWSQDLQFKEMLMGEIDKNAWVWVIDENNTVRAFDYDTGLWEPSKQFNLGQEFESYQITPAGYFLIALIPEYVAERKARNASKCSHSMNDSELTEAQKKRLKNTVEPHNPTDDFGDDDVTDEERGVPDEMETDLVAHRQKDQSSNEEDSEIVRPPVTDNLEVTDDEKEQKESGEHKVLSGRIEFHVFHLMEKKKLEYVVHKSSMTGYETGNEAEYKEGDEKEDFRVMDHILLPEAFSTKNDYVLCSKILVMESNKKDDVLLCAISNQKELLYHSMTVQVCQSKTSIKKSQQKEAIRKITKLDYLEYMIEKFGARATVFYPEDEKLKFHTSFILKEACQNAEDKCNQISENIMRSLQQKEKKSFEWMDWQIAVLESSNFDSHCTISQERNAVEGDEWIKKLIVQIPIQIARSTENQFKLMYNGEDDQGKYIKAINCYDLCKSIRLGAYDGLIKSWEGPIAVVTSMGKQSTGKSYMLNHLFGTKFDIAGGRCTDGAWLSVRVVDDIMYIICDFEGLGSIERSSQEDMLLATFNAAVSNCTIFKCDNRFERSLEDMFDSFQSGVKIMAGSKDCFIGLLLLVLKDVVETGEEDTVADFERHIKRLNSKSEVITDHNGKETSSFFVSQMYAAGLAIIPFSPLGNEAFFRELNTLDEIVDQTDIIHNGGNQFLNHLKMIMSKLSIGDFSAMSGEQAKIRVQEIKETLKNAVEVGCIVDPPLAPYGVTFQVDNHQNLSLLDGNKVITIPDIQIIFDKIKTFQPVIDAFSQIEPSIDVKKQMLKSLDSVNDAGLIFEENLKDKLLEFLLDLFRATIPRNHYNFEKWTALYQVFLDLIFFRRKERVMMYIDENTHKFEDDEHYEIEAIKNAANSRLNASRDHFKLCGQKCSFCYYPCLLSRGHGDQDFDEFDDDPEHSCMQSDHTCHLQCDYCKAKNVAHVRCDLDCGHKGKHDCNMEEHTCGKKCSLKGKRGCELNCNLLAGHEESCICAAAHNHFCEKLCGVKNCKNPCKESYNEPHDEHLCLEKGCPYKCQVKCWNDALQKVTPCGRPCRSQDHDHALRMERGDCKDEGHTCDQTHSCPELCKADGVCKVEVQQQVVKRIFITGTGGKIDYDLCAKPIAKTKRCVIRIPEGKFHHDGDDHKCSMDERVTHVCDETCDTCGYYCELKFGHNGPHDCFHGNMRKAKFYAAKNVLDTGSNRIYKVGDRGTAEMCHMLCQRQGRGHIHLELCPYAKKNQQCAEREGIRGIRHQTMTYYPNPELAKDEVKHSKYWRRKNWKDPCRPELSRTFELCPRECSHPIHKERREKGEEDQERFCTKNLWHRKCDTSTGHSFGCYHPFSNAHVIFICDISSSMGWKDAHPTHPFIKESKWLDNRLGYRDIVSAVMTPRKPEAFAAKRIRASKTFVKDYLLEFKYVSMMSTRENYGEAFEDAESVIKESQDTVIIFFTDGNSKENGAVKRVRLLKSKMKKKLKLRCITLGPKRDNSAVKEICDAGGGQLVETLTGDELGVLSFSLHVDRNDPQCIVFFL